MNLFTPRETRVDAFADTEILVAFMDEDGAAAQEAAVGESPALSSADARAVAFPQQA